MKTVNICRSLKTVLSVWLDTYPDDFREPPEYLTLSSLIEFTLCNACDNDLAQKARDQLSAFRDRDSLELTDSGLGMCSVYVMTVFTMHNTYLMILYFSAQ